MHVRRLLAAVGAGAVGAAIAATTVPAAALAAPVAPRGLTVTRAADNVNKIEISWKPATDVDHYKVDITQGETHTIAVLPSDAANYKIDAPDACASYKIRVGAVDAEGAETYTGYTFAKSLAPGAVMGMRTGREADGTVGTATWREPAWPGYTPLTGFHAQLVRLIDGVVLLDQVSPQTSYQFPNMDPTRAYVLRVTAKNEYGTCVTAKSLFDRYRPVDPISLTATRRAGAPATVDVAWKPSPETPAPTYYMLSYGVDKPSKTVRVDAPVTSTQLTLDPAASWVLQLKAYNENGGSGAITTSLSVSTVSTPVTPTQTGPVDTTPPTITASRSVQPSANGWHTGPVTISFTCTDSQSKVVSCPSPVTLASDGRDQEVAGTATDAAGNSAGTKVNVNIDQTAPTITAAVVGNRNAAGWHRTPPTIRYSCDDNLSAVLNCPADRRVGESGANQSFSASVSDGAGNTASAAVSDINVDLAAPTVRPVGASDRAVYTLDALPSVSCDTTDSVSGVAKRAGHNANRDELGTYTVTCADGSDTAENTAAPATITYTVRPTASSLLALTYRYLSANATNGTRQDLGSKLSHGQISQYIAKVLKEVVGKNATLSAAEAAELVYWAKVLGAQS